MGKGSGFRVWWPVPEKRRGVAFFFPDAEKPGLRDRAAGEGGPRGPICLPLPPRALKAAFNIEFTLHTLEVTGPDELTAR